MDQANEISVSFTLILLSIFFMLLLAVAIIAFFLLYQKRLFAQKDQMRSLETAYQKDLLKASITTQEIERKRVATDLHDGIGSLLSAIRLHVVQFKNKQSEQEYSELLQDTTVMVDTAIEHTRKIAHNLLPSTLERFGAVFAIKDLCKRIEQMSAMKITVQYENTPVFSKEQNLALYRIVQELITNTLKHAAATKINIQFCLFPSEMQMSYADNGKGFANVAGDKNHQGLGLRSITSRAQLINADIEIQAAPGAGFLFELTMPLGAKAEETTGS